MQALLAVAENDPDRGARLVVAAQTADSIALDAIGFGFYGKVTKPLEEAERKIFDEGADVIDDVRRWWRASF